MVNYGYATAYGIGVSVSNSNTWTALQSFANNISIGGITFAISSPTSGQVIQYNGTNWINALGGFSPATAYTFTALETFEPATSITAMAILGEQTTGATAMVNIVYTSTDANGLVAGTYPFIQATAGTDLFIGVQAGNSNVGTTAQWTSNVGVGYEALYSNTTGTFNSAFGWQALYANTIGSSNNAFGYAALNSNTTGSSNNAFGYEALYLNTTGNYNIAIGYQALYNYNDTNSNSDYLIAIGYSAGSNYTGAESNNILIGANVSGTAGESNVVRIGIDSTGTYGLLVGNLQASVTVSVPSSAGLNIAGGLGLAGKVPLFNNVTTAGFGVSAIYADHQEVELTSTNPTAIVTYTPTGQGDFIVYFYYRVTTASTTLTITLTYTDGTGSQTYTVINSVAELVGSYFNWPLYLNATSASAITLTATAGTSDQVYVSGSILELS